MQTKKIQVQIVYLLVFINSIKTIKESQNNLQNNNHQIIPAFSHFEFTNQNCNNLENIHFNSIEAFQQNDFRSFVLQNDPQEFPIVVEEYLKKIMSQEIQKFQSNLEEKLKNVLNAINTDVFQNKIKEEYSQHQFKSLYTENLKNQSLQQHEQIFEKIIQRMDSLDQLNVLYEEIQKNNEDEITVPYFLNQEKYKVTLQQQILKQVEKFDPEWKKHQEEYKNSKNIIEQSFKNQKSTLQDYIIFQDYYLSHDLDQKYLEEGEYIFWKPYSFSNFDKYFKNQNENLQKTFQLLYKTTVHYRATDKNLEFLNYLNNHIYQEDEKDLYYNVVFLVKYINDDKEPYEYQMIPGKSDYVLQLVDNIPEIRKYVEGQIKLYNLPITLNRFKLLIDNDDGFGLKEKTNQYLLQNKNIDELKHHMNSLSNEFIMDRKPLELPIQEFIINCLKDEKQEGCENQKINDLIEYFKEIQIYEDFIEKMKDDLEINLAIENFKKFINDQESEIVITSLHSLLDNTQADFCRHILGDLEIINEKLAFCNPKEHSSQNQEFTKLVEFLSFIKTFEFYFEEPRPEQTVIFGLFYLLSLDNRIKYQILQNKEENEFQDMYLYQLFDSNINQVFYNNDKFQEYLLKYFEMIKILNINNRKNQDIWLPEFQHEDYSNLQEFYFFFNQKESQNQLMKMINKIFDEINLQKEQYILNSYLFFIKSCEIIKSEQNAQDKVDNIKSLFYNVNNFEDENQIKNFDIQSASRQALFYQYLFVSKNNTQNKFNEKLNEMIKNDLDQKSKEFLTYYYSVKLIKIINQQQYEDGRKQTEENLEEKYKNFLDFNNSINENDQLYGSEINAYYSMIEMYVQIQKGFFSKIELKILKPMNNYTLELFHLFSYGENLILILETQKKLLDFVEDKNLQVFNTYLLFKSLSKQIYSKENAQNHVLQFIDNFYKDYNNQEISKFVNKNDLMLNIRNQYLISKVILGHCLQAENIFIEIDQKNAHLNEVALLTWIQEDDINESIKNSTIQKDEIFNEIYQYLDSQKKEVNFNFKFQHFLEEDLKGIFQSRCKYEEFNIIMTRNDPKPFENELQEIIQNCLHNDNKENKNIYSNNVYQLFQGIQVAMAIQQSDNLNRQNNNEEISRKLFHEIQQKAFENLEQQKIMLILQRLLNHKKNFYINSDFQKFLQNLIELNNDNQLKEKIEKEQTKKVFLTDLDQMINLIIGDFLKLSKDFKFTNEENFNLQNYDLFNIIITNNEYYEFQGNLFQDMNFNEDQKENSIQTYLQVYLILNIFRIEKMSQNIKLENNSKLFQQRFNNLELIEEFSLHIESRIKFVEEQFKINEDRNQEEIFNLYEFTNNLNIIWNIFMKKDLTEQENEVCDMIILNYLLQGQNLKIQKSNLHNKEEQLKYLSFNNRLKQILSYINKQNETLKTQIKPKIKCLYKEEELNKIKIMENSKYIQNLLNSDELDTNYLPTNFSQNLNQIQIEKNFEKKSILFL